VSARPDGDCLQFEEVLMKRSILASIVVVVGVLGLAAQPALSFDVIPDGLVKACVDHGQCKGAEEFLRAAINRTEKSCAETNVIAEKLALTDELLQYQKQADTLGIDGLAVSYLEVCAGFLDPEVTYIQIEPGISDVAVGDEVQLAATIRCSNGICEGQYDWVPLNPGIASVDGNGLATALSGGTATIKAVSRDWVELTGSAVIHVEAAAVADIAFVLAGDNMTSWTFLDYWTHNGIMDHIGDITDTILNNFSDFRVAIEFFDNPQYFPYGSVYHLGFVDQLKFSSDIDEIAYGFSSLESNWEGTYTDETYCSPNMNHAVMGLSALEIAIDGDRLARSGVSWREAICGVTEISEPQSGKRIDIGVDDNGNSILENVEIDQTWSVLDGDGGPAKVNVTVEPAGDNCPSGGHRIGYANGDDAEFSLAYACNPVRAIILLQTAVFRDPEPTTGFTSAQVIQDALAKNIRIFAVNGEWEGYRQFQCIEEQFTGLANGTGGGYYSVAWPAWQWEAIVSALEDIAGLSSADGGPQ
jgi:hypothetical protein